MKIGIIGSGQIGGTAARLLAEAGHEVALSNSRGPESLTGLVDDLGPRARAMTVDEAAEFGDVVLLAVPWRVPEALPAPEHVEDKVVIDAMNPYAEDGSVLDLGDSSSSEETAKRLPGAKIVKAFNTIFYQHLAERGRSAAPTEERHAIFLAGDDPVAKATVAKLISDTGFAPVDTGSLAAGGRMQEPGTSLYNRPMTGADAANLVAREAARRA